MWLLTTVCNFSSRISYVLFWLTWAPGTHVAGTHIHMQANWAYTSNETVLKIYPCGVVGPQHACWGQKSWFSVLAFHIVKSGISCLPLCTPGCLALEHPWFSGFLLPSFCRSVGVRDTDGCASLCVSFGNLKSRVFMWFLQQAIPPAPLFLAWKRSVEDRDVIKQVIFTRIQVEDNCLFFVNEGFVYFLEIGTLKCRVRTGDGAQR